MSTATYQTSYNFTKAVRTFIIPLLLAILTLLLGPPPKTYANGPIPFSEDFNTFTGSGFAPGPGVGQLDSDIWIVTGLSDGSISFGDTQTSGDFARGPSTGGVGTGGIYAFDVGGGNAILGVQPIGSDFTPGEIILRLQNNTGSTITQLDVSYDIWYRNDQARANSFNFSHSPDNTAYTSIAALDFTTPLAADALGWQPAPRSTTLTGLDIANGDFFYLKWTGNDVSGSGSRDEYGLDKVQVDVSVGDSPPSVAGTTPTSGATGVAVNTNVALDFSEAVTVTGNWFQIVCGSSGTYNVADTVVAGGPTNRTIDPNTDFSNGETCTVTVFAAQVTDQDGPPDNMAADYTFDFTTIATVSGWVINEIHADPDGTNGDANGDGIVGVFQDEFIEIVNNTGGVVDISNWTLSDDTGVRHIFPTGTIVPDQCAVVVFGGGTPTGTFGGAIVQTAGTLGLNNGGDTITLNDGSTDQATYPYGSEGGDNQSLTRDPDVIGADPLVKHSTVAGSGGALFSPGTRIDGSPFSVCAPPDIPPTVVTTIPSDGAMGVAISTTIDIQFSEVVTTAANTFALECPVGPLIAFSVAPAPPGNANSLVVSLGYVYRHKE